MESSIAAASSRSRDQERFTDVSELCCWPPPTMDSVEIREERAEKDDSLLIRGSAAAIPPGLSFAQ